MLRRGTELFGSPPAVELRQRSRRRTRRASEPSAGALALAGAYGLQFPRLDRVRLLLDRRFVDVRRIGGSTLGIGSLLAHGEPGVVQVKAPRLRTFSPHGSLPLGVLVVPQGRSLPMRWKLDSPTATEPKAASIPPLSSSGSYPCRSGSYPDGPPSAYHAAQETLYHAARLVAGLQGARDRTVHRG